MQSLIKYNEKPESNKRVSIGIIREGDFNKLLRDISIKELWTDSEKKELQVFIKNIKDNIMEKPGHFYGKIVLPKKFLREIHNMVFKKNKLSFTKTDIEEIIKDNPIGVHQDLFEKLLNQEELLYGEKPINWLVLLMGEKYNNKTQDSYLKLNSLISYYYKTKEQQKEPKWSYLFDILERTKEDYKNGFENYINIIKKEDVDNRGSILEENSKGENIISMVLLEKSEYMFAKPRDFMDLKKYISKVYGVESFKKLFNAPIGEKNLIKRLNHNGLLKDDEYIELVKNISDENIKKMSEEDFISLIEKKRLPFKDLKEIMDKRKEKKENILESLISNYKKDVPQEMIKELYKKEIGLDYQNLKDVFKQENITKKNQNSLDITSPEKIIEKYKDILGLDKSEKIVEKNQNSLNIINPEKIIIKNKNLLDLSIKYKMINNDYYVEENELLIKSISEMPGSKEKKDLMKKIFSVKKYKIEQIKSILNIIGKEKEEVSYQHNILQLILSQDKKFHDELISEYLKDNISSDALNTRLLVLQKYNTIKLSSETQEELIQSQLNKKHNTVLINIIFESDHNQKTTKEKYENININKTLAEKVINNYLESESVSANGLINIALNYRSIQGLELSEEIKNKIKINLIEQKKSGKNFNDKETQVKKASEKIKLMCQWLYLDEYYINKEEKKEMIKEIIKSPDWEAMNNGYAKKIWSDEILHDLVTYHINQNKEFFKDFLEIDNVNLKVLIAERIVNEVIDNKYIFNKLGKEIIKQSVEIIAKEAKPRNQEEEFLLNHIIGNEKKKVKRESLLEHIGNFDKKVISQEKNIDLVLELLNMEKKCYLDVLSLNENKKIEETIKGKEKFFISKINKESLVEYINEGKLEDKTIEKLMSYMIYDDTIVEDVLLRVKSKYINNIDIMSKVCLLSGNIKNTDNHGVWDLWGHLGKEIKEVLKLTDANHKEKLYKYSSTNTDGVFGYIAKRRKENLQEEINKEWEIRDKEEWNIKKWLKRSEDIKKYLNKDELTELSNLEKEVKKIRELGIKNISQYSIQEIRKNCEHVINIMGAEEFINKASEVRVKIEKVQEEIKENIKMELKKEVAIIKYKF